MQRSSLYALSTHARSNVGTIIGADCQKSIISLENFKQLEIVILTFRYFLVPSMHFNFQKIEQEVFISHIITYANHISPFGKGVARPIISSCTCLSTFALYAPSAALMKI